MGHVDIPDKAEVIPESSTVILPTPTPKSACEYEIDDLKIDLESARNIIKDFECVCGDPD